MAIILHLKNKNLTLDVQKHVNTAKVVIGKIDFLSKETLTHFVITKNFSELEQQQTTTANRSMFLLILIQNEKVLSGSMRLKRLETHSYQSKGDLARFNH